MRFEIKQNHCDCHVETCNCFNYYIFLGDKKISGSDNLKDLEKTLQEIRRAK